MQKKLKQYKYNILFNIHFNMQKKVKQYKYNVMFNTTHFNLFRKT